MVNVVNGVPELMIAWIKAKTQRPIPDQIPATKKDPILASHRSVIPNVVRDLTMSNDANICPTQFPHCVRDDRSELGHDGIFYLRNFYFSPWLRSHDGLEIKPEKRS